MPEVAPVITATLPSRRPGICKTVTVRGVRLRHAHSQCARERHSVPRSGQKIGRLIWPCSADDDATARRLGWCCCWGAALRLAGRAAGPHACRAQLGGSRVAGGCGKPVRRCGGGKSPATEGALSES